VRVAISRAETFLDSGVDRRRTMLLPVVLGGESLPRLERTLNDVVLGVELRRGLCLILLLGLLWAQHFRGGVSVIGVCVT